MTSNKLNRRDFFFLKPRRPAAPQSFLERFYGERNEAPAVLPSFHTDPSVWSKNVESSSVGLTGVTGRTAYYEDSEEES